MWFVPTMRDELYGQSLTCTESEKFPFDTTGISTRGIGGAAKNLTTQAVQANPSFVNAMNSFDIWQNASPDVNSTVNSLYTTGNTLNNLQIARNTAMANGSPQPAIDNLNTLVAGASAAFGSAVNIPATNAQALQSSLNQVVAAAGMFGFANYLDANPLPSAPTCFYADGEAYIQNALAFDWIHRDAQGAITGYGGFGCEARQKRDRELTFPSLFTGIDHPFVTSTGFYMGVCFITGVGWAFVAYLALWLCNFRWVSGQRGLEAVTLVLLTLGFLSLHPQTKVDIRWILWRLLFGIWTLLGALREFSFWIDFATCKLACNPTPSESYRAFFGSLTQISTSCPEVPCEEDRCGCQ